MRKQLNILFKLVVVALLLIALTSEDPFAQSNFKYLEVSDYEIEEENTIDFLTLDISDQRENKGKNYSKEHANLGRNISTYNSFIDIQSILKVTDYEIRTLTLPKYILFCSLIVYA